MLVVVLVAFAAAACAPLLFKGQQGAQLTIIRHRLPAAVAHDLERFGRGVTLGDEHGARHQRAATDSVLAVQERSATVRQVIQHPIDAGVELIVGKTMSIRGRQVQKLHAGSG